MKKNLEKNFDVKYLQKALGAKYADYTVEISSRTKNRIYIYREYENRLMINIIGEIVTYFDPVSPCGFNPAPEVKGDVWKRGSQLAILKVENIDEAIEKIKTISNF